MPSRTASVNVLLNFGSIQSGFTSENAVNFLSCFTNLLLIELTTDMGMVWSIRKHWCRPEGRMDMLGRKAFPCDDRLALCGIGDVAEWLVNLCSEAFVNGEIALGRARVSRPAWKVDGSHRESLKRGASNRPCRICELA